MRRRTPEASEQAVLIGTRITQARLEQGGMSQAELAALLGLSERSIQAYETGEVIPYRQMRDLERVLKKPVAWFLHGEAALEARDSQFETIVAMLTTADERLARIEKALGQN